MCLTQRRSSTTFLSATVLKTEFGVEPWDTSRLKISRYEWRRVLNQITYPVEGGCDCRHVRYQPTSNPLIVHCCHCRWCQRETGSSFALNAAIESDRLISIGAEPEIIDTPSASGKGQKIFRCPKCKMALWSHYAGAGSRLSFVHVGTLDVPDNFPPDLHIFTSTKQPWVVLPPEAVSFSEYYAQNDYWPPESLARREAALSK